MKIKFLLCVVCFLILILGHAFGQITINIGDPFSSENLPTLSTSETFANTVTVSGATGNAYWAFDGVPAGATLSPDGSTLEKDGITITLPAAEDEEVSPAQPVNITGGGTATSFSVNIRVTDDGSISGGQPATTKEVILTVRSNVSVGFVLDRSGSMGREPAGTSGTGVTRWDILETSSSVFLEKLNTYQLAGDQASLTYFAGSADNPAPGFGGGLTEVSGNLAAFTGDIGSQTPNGGTAMGDGLIAGKNKLEAGPADRTKVLFLFTDGEQNRGDEVNPAGTATIGGTSLNNGSNSIRIYTIGTGAAALTPAATLLENIATENNGEAFIVTETASNDVIDEINAQSANYFDQTFVDILAGSSPQMVERQKGVGKGFGNVTSSASSSPVSHTFDVNRGVEKVGFQVVTRGEDVRIRVKKGNTDVTKFGQNSSRPGYYYYNMNFPNRRVPAMHPEGSWEVQVMAQRGQQYTITCIVDDHALKYDATANDGPVTIGDDINPVLNLSRFDSAITDAKVVVTVLRPGDDQGHLLATMNADIGGSNRLDPGSIGYQKYLALLQQNPAFARALAANPNRISLSHQSGGLYTGNFTNTDVSGAYQLLFEFEGEHPRLGKYKRIALRSVVVRPPAIDIATSGATVKTGANGTAITFRPSYTVNGQQRFYGPAYGKYFSVSGNGVSLGGVDEQADGTYTLNVNGNADANMTLSLLGTEVYKGKVGSFAEPAGSDGGALEKLKTWWEGLGLPMWLFWVLIVVVLLALVLISRKKKA